MYDARGSSSGGADQIRFALLTIALVAAVFLVALFWPAGNGATRSNSAVRTVAFQTAMPDIRMERFQTALMSLDPGAYTKMERALGRARTEEQAIEVLTKDTGRVLTANKALLAKAPAHHFDRLLDLTKSKLRAASRSDAGWCDGARYVALMNNPRADAARAAFEKELAAGQTELGQYSVDMLTLIMEAAIDARKNGVEHGSLTAQDEAILQGVAISLMGDRQMLPFLLAAQGQGDPTAALAKLDVCAAGLSLMVATSTMPTQTKGRVWAEIARGGKGLSPTGFR